MKLLNSAKPSTLLILAALTLLPVFRLRGDEKDDRIEAAAKQTYVFRTFLMDDSIKVKCTDGSVILSGTVSEESHRMLASDTLLGLPGVKSVENQIVIKNDGPSDGWLRIKVKNTLAYHRNVSATRTKVEAKAGIVTLSGIASSQAQKELTSEYAKDVEGVIEVHNWMEVVDGDPLKVPTTTITEIIDDASITAQVRMALLSHVSTSAIKTKITTVEGFVTIEGPAKSGAEKDLVTKLVADIYGVKKLSNLMTLPDTK